MHVELHKGMETHRSKRLAADGSASDDDVRIVILVNAEKALKCRLVAETAREFESATRLVRATDVQKTPGFQG